MEAKRFHRICSGLHPWQATRAADGALLAEKLVKDNQVVFDGLPLKDKTKSEYPEMLHALSIELGREKVFADILNWLEKRI